MSDYYKTIAKMATDRSGRMNYRGMHIQSLYTTDRGRTGYIICDFCHSAAPHVRYDSLEELLEWMDDNDIQRPT